MTAFWRVRPGLLRHFPPCDGELYLEVGPGEIPEYVLVQVGRRAQRIPRANFERVELPEESSTSE